MTGTRGDRGTWRRLRDDRRLALVSMTRVLGAGLAIVLLLAHQVTHADPLLAVTALVWAPLSLLALRRAQDEPWAPAVWGVDMIAAFALVLAGGDWRSPFYVFALTTLVMPATSLPWRRAVAWGVA